MIVVASIMSSSAAAAFPTDIEGYTPGKVEMANNANPPDKDQENPIVSAQPVVYSSHASAVGTGANAPPQQAQQAGTLHQPIHPNTQFRSRPPPNRWADSICDWPSNLFPSCWCVCCCYYGMWLVAQSEQNSLPLISALLFDIYCTVDLIWICLNNY